MTSCVFICDVIVQKPFTFFGGIIVKYLNLNFIMILTCFLYTFSEKCI